MAFTGLSRRPNEANENVIKAFKFIDQANTLFELGILTPAQKKLVTGKLNNLTVEVKKLYELEDEHAKTLKEEKVAESLSSTFRSSVSLLENRLELSNIELRLEETRSKVQKRYDDVRQLSHSVQRINMETQREAERNEHRRNCAKAANSELLTNSEIIKNNLENSAEVCKLRRSEEKKRMTEEAVEKLRSQKIQYEADIKIMQATLKSEKKKSFQKVVIECARAHQLFKTLLPKLSSSKKNVESLKAEELSRKSNGSLDETILFDNSFVQVSMDTTPAVSTGSGKEVAQPNPESKTLPKPSEKVSTPQAPPPERVEKVKDTSPVRNESEMGSVSDSGNSAQNITIVDNEMEVEEKEEEPVEMVEKSIDEDQNEADESKNMSEEAMDQEREEDDGNERLDESQEEMMEQDEGEEQKEQEEEENENNKSIDVMMNEEGEGEGSEDVANVSKNASFNFSRDSNSGGFFDKLLSKKSSDDSSSSKKSAADAILNISANSNDEASDLLKEMENQMSGDEVMSQESGKDGNFSFNIFGESSSANHNDSGSAGNFDFNFGSSSDDNNCFDFMGGSSGGDGDNDPFGFAKGNKKNGDGSGDGMSFDFNFGSDNGATGGGESSFFNF